MGRVGDGRIVGISGVFVGILVDVEPGSAASVEAGSGVDGDCDVQAASKMEMMIRNGIRRRAANILPLKLFVNISNSLFVCSKLFR